MNATATAPIACCDQQQCAVHGNQRQPAGEQPLRIQQDERPTQQDEARDCGDVLPA